MGAFHNFIDIEDLTLNSLHTTLAHTHTHIYIYIYIYVCVCVTGNRASHTLLRDFEGLTSF